jgi:nucleotide-binding universal stress UspA family protein
MSGIVLGYDHSEAAEAAMHWSIGQARRTSTAITVVYVVSSVVEWELAAVQINPDPVRHEFEQVLKDKWTAPLRTAGIEHHTTVRVGRVADELMHLAVETAADLIVIGMTTHGSLAELVSKSTLRTLRGRAVRPVVTVPAGWSEGQDDPSLT